MCVCVCVRVRVCVCVCDGCTFLQSLLTLDHCVGIIGGKPKHSVYFVGFQGMDSVITANLLVLISSPPLLYSPATEDKLLHLDPHYCQPTVSIAGEDFDIKVRNISDGWVPCSYWLLWSL